LNNKKLETITNLFDGNEIRSVWDSDMEDYYFSVVDVVSALTNSPEPRKYWSVMKNRLKKEGSELTTVCSQLKLKSSDGKYYKLATGGTSGNEKPTHSKGVRSDGKLSWEYLHAGSGTAKIVEYTKERR